MSVATNRTVAGAVFVTALLGAGLMGTGQSPAASPPIKPYKDDLFQNRVIKTLFGGDYRFVEYSKERDLYGRDEVVEKKAFAKFVSPVPDKLQSDLVLQDGARKIRYVGVGAISGDARFIVIFLHGDHGSRFQAVDDWTFGGNFNRLKNLVVRSGGVYVSADFGNFGRRGTDDVKALMKAYAEHSGGAPVIVACTSRSGVLCFRLLADDEAAPLLGGMLLLGSGSEESFFEEPVFTDPARAVPLFIGHGSNDKIITWVTQELFFKKVKAARPDYPIKFDLFVHGSHGTPMRLTDWRRVLNWMLTTKSG